MASKVELTGATKICAACPNIIKDKSGYMQCSTCMNFYDLLCANVSTARYKLMTKEHKKAWICDDCRNKRPKSDNSNTPLRAVQSIENDSTLPYTTPSASSNSKVERKESASEFVTQRTKSASQHQPCATKSLAVSRDDLRLLIRQEIQSSIRELIDERLKGISKQIRDFEDSLTFMNNIYEDFKKGLDTKFNVVEELKKENSALQQAVTDLSHRLNAVEQNMRENNIELNGIPEQRSENLSNIVIQLTKTVDNPIISEDILHVTRVSKLSKNERPRSVIVKLRSARQRDEVIAAVIKYNRKNPKDKLSSVHLGLSGNRTPVYVSEHLTPTSKALHAATRLKAKELSYKFVWVRNGRIFVRKDEESQHKLIRNTESLSKLV